ncbi:MAG: hypothetical protein MJ217_00030 [Bacilli bacterium]|nr:hypothetical protein [Bacilli bacterium]
MNKKLLTLTIAALALVGCASTKEVSSKEEPSSEEPITSESISSSKVEEPSSVIASSISSVAPSSSSKQEDKSSSAIPSSSKTPESSSQTPSSSSTTPVSSSTSEAPKEQKQVTVTFAEGWSTHQFDTQANKQKFVDEFNAKAGEQILDSCGLSGDTYCMQIRDYTLADKTSFRVLQFGSGSSDGKLAFVFNAGIEVYKLDVEAQMYYRNYKSGSTEVWGNDYDSILYVNNKDNKIDFTTTETITGIPESKKASFNLDRKNSFDLFNETYNGRVFLNSLTIYYYC